MFEKAGERGLPVRPFPWARTTSVSRGENLAQGGCVGWVGTGPIFGAKLRGSFQKFGVGQ